MADKNDKPKRLNKRGDTRGVNEGSQRGWANVKPRWKKGESGNPKGRPRDRVKELMDGLLTVKQVKENTNLEQRDIDAIEQIILSLDTPALQAIAKSEKTPVYMRTLAMAAMWDMKNGKTQTVNTLRDRQFGAVKKQVDVTSNGQSMGIGMTPDEARDLLKDLEENC